MQILQNTKKNLENKIKLKTPFPRISTRGYYDLTTGSTKKNSNYYLYPKRSFENLYGQKEICIMIHGLRNDKIGAVNKFKIAKRNLQKIGYKFPVIGFSYDSNTKGAHLKKTEFCEKFSQTRGGVSRFHTLIQISYILLQGVSF